MEHILIVIGAAELPFARGVQSGMAMMGKQAEINVTPLIDVLLVLLIIFMVIVPTKSTGLDAKIPQPAESAKGPPREIVISVAEDLSVKINTQPVEWNDLDERLRQIFAQRPDGQLFVAGAPTVEFENIARVLDVARGVGITKVALMPRSR